MTSSPWLWAGPAAAFAAVAAAASPAAARPGVTKGVASADLVAAAKAARLKDIDYLEELCRNDRTVAAWLAELTAGEARSVRWSGGRCVLVDRLNPLDGGGDWCVQAEITLFHPSDAKDRPMVEIYLDRETDGAPLTAYAFRGLIDDAGLLRFRWDFENAWLERFPANGAKIRCPDDPASPSA